MEPSQEHADATGIREELGDAVSWWGFFFTDRLLPISTPD